LVLFVVLLVGATPLQALGLARYVAPTGVDSGQCTAPAAPCRTLQYAIDRAANGDTINMAAGTYTDVNNNGGTQQIAYVSGKAITIVGGFAPGFAAPPDPGAYPTILDAALQGRVFRVRDLAQLTIEGVQITGGTTDSDWDNNDGGGLNAEQATVTLRRCQLYGNSTSIYGDGAGLAGTGATVLVEDCRITGNQTWRYGHGGGVCLHDSQSTLRHTVISTNTANFSGGGIIVSHGTATIQDCDIFSNTTDYSGGGIALTGSRATLQRNTISRNTSNGPGNGDDGGGGVYVTSSPTVLAGNVIAGNTTTSFGGGVMLYAATAVTLTDNLIVGNEAHSAGGMGVYAGTALIDGNIVVSNTAHYGGGIYLGDGQALLRNNTVAYNSATYEYGGGGGIMLSNMSATLVNNLIVHNTTPEDGSALYIASAVVSLTHTTIADNLGGYSAIYIRDGGMPPWGPATVAFSNTIIAGHDVGIMITALSTARLEATLWDNGTDWMGAGIVVTGTVNIWGDPGFVNPAAGDYHLGPASEALDQGIDAGITSDFERQPRPYQAPDLGADEYWPPGALKRAYLPLVLRGAGAR